MALAAINSIWIGPELGPIHTACLRSFLRHGHEVTLYVYEPPRDLPPGIAIRSAEELLPYPVLLKGRERARLSMLSNLLRHELLRLDRGIYVDCDAYCLKPLEDADYVFGWDSDKIINNAVLKLPPDSPVLETLCQLKNRRRFVPPWEHWAKRAYYRLRTATPFPVNMSDMRTGTSGPRALTWYLKEAGQHTLAQPIDVFYPVNYKGRDVLFEAGRTIADVTTPNTIVLHLYSHRVRVEGERTIPDDSPMGEILAA